MHICILHYTVLSQNQGDYSNSHVLQAMELPPRAGEARRLGKLVYIVT